MPEPMPLLERVRLAILSAREVCDDPEYVNWADDWISDTDRSLDTCRTFQEQLRQNGGLTTIDQAVWYAVSAATWAAATRADEELAEYYIRSAQDATIKAVERADLASDRKEGTLA